MKEIPFLPNEPRVRIHHISFEDYEQITRDNSIDVGIAPQKPRLLNGILRFNDVYL